MLRSMSLVRLFVFFDRVGRELLGAPLISLLRHGRSPVAPLLEIVRSARGDPLTPRELSAVTSRKFRFVVSISSKCFSSDDDDLSFQVLRIDTPLGKQPVFCSVSGLQCYDWSN